MLRDEIEKQSDQFAICCIYMRSDSSTTGEAYSDWPDATTHAVSAITNNKSTLIIEDAHHISLIVQSCSEVLATRLARLIRNQLMKKYPNVIPSLSIAHITSLPVEVDDLLRNLCSTLSQRVVRKSSRIEVVTY